MVALYEYRSAGRRPLTVAAYLIALTVLGLTARSGATLPIWAVWAVLTTALSHHLLTHSVSGSRIDAKRWVTFIDRKRRAILLRSILKVILCDCAHGRCACTVHLRTGETLKIPACCLPPAATLSAKLLSQGVTVERA